jgi:hypothetical protein
VFRYEPLLTSLVSEYQLFWSPEEKSKCLTELLSLQQPCHPERLFRDAPECALALNSSSACAVCFVLCLCPA